MPKDFTLPTWVPIEELSIEDMKEELDQLRNLWDWTDPRVRWHVARAGRDCVLVTRKFSRLYGVLGQVNFEPTQVEATVVNREWHSSEGKSFDEVKQISIPYSMLSNLEILLEASEVQADPLPGGLSDETLEELIGVTDTPEELTDENYTTGTR